MSDQFGLSRFFQIIREEHLPLLGIALKKIPDFAWLLTTPHSKEDRLQGDILADFPTVFLDNEGNPRSKRFAALLLNNSCDLPDNRLGLVTVAPIIDFQSYLTAEKSRFEPAKFEIFAASIRRNEKTELLYLPVLKGFYQGALVLLHMACSVSTELYKTVSKQNGRLASFSQPGFYFLLIKLTQHIARIESDEIVREVPSAA